MRSMLVLCCLALLAAVSAAPATAGEAYLIGPGDVLDVSVWNDEALTREVLVRPDGSISFPLIGDVAVAGLSVDQVRLDVEQRIRDYVSNAPVTVILTELASARVFVVGKVAEPGQYSLAGPTRVMQALAMAGGLTTFADEDSILVLRDAADGQQAIPFDYSKISSGRDLSSNIVLKPGDTVVVP